MELKVAQSSDIATIKITGQLWEQHDLLSLEKCVDEFVVKRIRYVVFDVARLSFISSQGLGAIIKLYSKLKSSHSELILFRPKDIVLETFEISGFDKFIKIASNEHVLARLLREAR